MPAEATKPEAPVENLDNLEIALVLTVGEINVILQMFGERPLKDVINLFSKIRSQADRSVAQRAETVRQTAMVKEQGNGAANGQIPEAGFQSPTPTRDTGKGSRRRAKPNAPH